MRVLLVDDDERMRQVLGRLLLSAGFHRVDHACDGADALRMLALPQYARPHLILTDCRMPRLDGLSFVRALRSQGDRTPVIMISAEHAPHQVVEVIRAGVDNYVPKPIHPQALFEKIWQTLGISRAVAL